MKDILTMFFAEMKAHLQQWRLIMNLTLQIDRYDFVHRLAITKIDGYVSLFEELLGKMGWPNPKDEAKLLTALFDGVGLQYFILKEDYDLDEMERILLQKYCSP